MGNQWLGLFVFALLQHDQSQIESGNRGLGQSQFIHLFECESIVTSGLTELIFQATYLTQLVDRFCQAPASANTFEEFNAERKMVSGIG